LRQWRSSSIISKSNLTKTISVIIAARNEEKTIFSCISSVIDACKNYDDTNNYFEIIIVDDHSLDSTFEKALSIKHPNLFLFHAKGTGKKEAIKQGVHIAKGEILLFTDADTIVHKNWVRDHAVYQQNYDFVTGIVRLENHTDTLANLQIDDMVATMLLTNAGIQEQKFYIANGANMSCKKNIWFSMEDIRNDQHISSGDDVFLIEAIRKSNPSAIAFLSKPNSFVTTQVMTSWKDFLNQRRRWASKTFKTSNHYLTLLYFLVTLIVLGIWGSILFGLLSENIYYIIIGVFGLLSKLFIDYLYLYRGRTLLQYDIKNNNYLKSALLYQYYILVMAFSALFPKKIIWKSRNLEKISK
jgi:cellulose synthase/poly-beta-1,6-N-acetylglucosamine synthase-like glycosyltransferase